MPKVGQIGSFRVVIYFNDHRPAHVHVIGASCEAIFYLNCPSGPPKLRVNYDCSRADLGHIAAELTRLVVRLCHDWKRINERV